MALGDGSYRHGKSTGLMTRKIWIKHAGFYYLDGLMSFLAKRRYQSLNTDSFVVVKSDAPVTTIISITIYDFLILVTTQASVESFYRDILNNYKVKILGLPTKYLGWKIRYVSNGTIHLSQPEIAAVTVPNSGL